MNDKDVQSLQIIKDEYMKVLDESLNQLIAQIPPKALTMKLRDIFGAEKSIIDSGQISVPGTPKFHPDLPETPAQLRRAAVLRKQQAALTESNSTESLKGPNKENEPRMSAIRRITAATLKVQIPKTQSSVEQTPQGKGDVFAVPDGKPRTSARKRAPANNKTRQMNITKELLSPQQIVLEMDNGETMGLDIANSPSTTIKKIKEQNLPQSPLRNIAYTYMMRFKDIFTKLSRRG